MAHKTNEQLLRQLIRSCEAAGPMGCALLAERIQKVSQITRQFIAENPTGMDTRFTSSGMYLELCDIIDKTFAQ